jgi:hypothetical protein
VILRAAPGPPPGAVAAYALGKAAASDPEPAYALAGPLYLSASGWVIVGVPNALVRGVFDAIVEPGVELPPPGPDGRLNAHVSVMSPDDVKLIGGPDRVTERGHQFRYTLGRLVSFEPTGWSGTSRVWALTVHSPDLQALRRSYGLSGLPRNGEGMFHVTVARRREKVLGRNETGKGEETAPPTPPAPGA